MADTDKGDKKEKKEEKPKKPVKRPAKPKGQAKPAGGSGEKKPGTEQDKKPPVSGTAPGGQALATTGQPAPRPKGRNGNGRTKEEERRRRVILALWLLMFSILTGVFVFIFLNLFSPAGRKETAKKCLDCHDKGMARQLKAQYKHEPFERERCTECHKDVVCDKEKKKFAVLKGSLKTICFGCHTKAKSDEKKKNVHKPFKGKRCTDCHDPHGSDFEKITILPANELCVSCHYGSSFTQVFKHQPAEMRNCIDCHEPHSSDYDKHMTMDEGDLCYSCHLRVAQQTYRPFKHKPFGDEKCVDCHKPHSAGEKRLLVKEYNSMCKGCHPIVEGEFGKPNHHPLGRAPIENCGKCHLYHSADYAKLLPLPGTVNCYQAPCHPGLRETFEASEHNSSVMAMLAQRNFAVNCSACHSPHGSDYTRMLTKSKYTVCQTCHTFAGTIGEHTVFTHVNQPPAPDRWHGDYMWCGSCHAFHGSPFPNMRLAWGDDLCIKCHNTEQMENVNR